jgi:putative hydrolase of the HAD superfamily
MRFADLDAVTVDGFGTLVELIDPVPRLQELLREQSAGRDETVTRDAFAAEVGYYRANSLTGRDERTLAELRERCAQVFLDAADAELDAAAFAPSFVAALRFRVLPGVTETLRELRARGLEVAIVSNWDISLHERVEELGLRPLTTTVVTSAEAGSEKPDPRIFRVALERLGVDPARAVHVGDGEADADGAAAAGIAFEPAPLAEAVRRWR